MLSHVEALTEIVEEIAYPQMWQRVVVATPSEIAFWPEDDQKATLRVGKFGSLFSGDQRQETYARVEGITRLAFLITVGCVNRNYPLAVSARERPPFFA